MAGSWGGCGQVLGRMWPSPGADVAESWGGCGKADLQPFERGERVQLLPRHVVTAEESLHHSCRVRQHGSALRLPLQYDPSDYATRARGRQSLQARVPMGETQSFASEQPMAVDRLVASGSARHPP